jgi:hypothetical protein
MTSIINVKPGRPDFSFFEKLAESLYPKDGFILPNHINTDYLQACFVLMENDKPKARLALYKNPHLRYKGKNTFCIGNYECVNNPDASKKIITHAIEEAKKLGAEYIIGPMNGSTWDAYRFSTHHDEPSFFLEPYQHLYYNDQFIASGFEVIGKYFSSIDKDLLYDQPAVLQKTKEFKEMGVVFRNININKYKEELEKLYPFLLEAFKTNFLYTPISKDAFLKKYLESEKIIDPEFVIIAEDEEGNPVGLFFCVKDLLNKKEKSMVVKTLARHPDKKWKGLGHVIGNEITKRCVQQGYSSMIHALIYEQGTSLDLSKNYSGKVYKNYVLYGKNL